MTIPTGNDNLFISYFLQSSVAEASILMFSDFCFSNTGKCVPLYIIHDAVILDATHELVLELGDSHKLKFGDWEFDASITILGDT